MTHLKAIALGGAGLLIALFSPPAYAIGPWPESPIEWLLDCPRLPGRQPDLEVLARTQCAVVTVPRDHDAPARGNLRLSLTRVGARQPLNRQGVVFTQHGDLPENSNGALAIHLASLWKQHDTSADRMLANRFDVIELSPRDLNKPQALEHSVRDMELVRGQLGEERLHYLSGAYASELGTRYAERYPERIDRMVLLDSTAYAGPWLRLKGPYGYNADPCVRRWVAEYLAYAKQPPPSTICVGVPVAEASFTTSAY